MNTTIYCLCSNLLAACAICIPIYYVIFRRRFWHPAFVSWLSLVASQQFAVLGSSSSDTTTVGLTLFTGWLLTVPYCGILVLIRILLLRFSLLPSKYGDQDASIVNSSHRPVK
jgi:hypothetical protein